MTPNHKLDPLFWQILEKNRLVDLSQFHRPDFCDEVPLYTRESDIGFLTEYSRDQANAILLAFALKFLRSVIAYEEHTRPYFAAITIWSSPKNEPIVPNLFAHARLAQEQGDSLLLRPVATSFGKRMKALLPRLDLFDVQEDTSTVPKMSRVFIGPSESPYDSFVTLGRFREPLKSVR